MLAQIFETMSLGRNCCNYCSSDRKMVQSFWIWV